MGRPEIVVNRIMPALMMFIERGRKLPATSEGKVNGSELRVMLQSIDPDNIKGTDEQHFWKKTKLKEKINEYAEQQGLLPVGNRVSTPEAEAEFEELTERLNQAQRDSSDNAQKAVEASAAHYALLEELEQTRAELEETKLKNRSLEERLRSIEDNGLLFPLN